MRAMAFGTEGPEYGVRFDQGPRRDQEPRAASAEEIPAPPDTVAAIRAKRSGLPFDEYAFDVAGAIRAASSPDVFGDAAPAVPDTILAIRRSRGVR